MIGQYHTLMENNTWYHVYIPKRWKLVHCIWLYETKYALDDSIEKNKAYFIVKEFSQVEENHYYETFSLIAKINSIFHIYFLTASESWFVYHMDVKSTFLYVNFHEEIYTDNTPSFV